MTSTNINIGFDGRSSSRVLKPPGGGHSDIFGVHEDDRQVKPKSRHQGSSITDCFRMEETVTKTENGEKIEQVVEQKTETKTIEQVTEHKTEIIEHKSEQQNGKVEIINTDNTDKKNEENIKPEDNKNEQNGKIETPSVPQRVRVPPGGFSSGFW